jgi:hypothetical protein
MARHSRFVGEEARDAKSKEARRSLIHTGNWEEKEEEEECANYKAEHDPQPQGSDDRTEWNFPLQQAIRCSKGGWARHL